MATRRGMRLVLMVGALWCAGTVPGAVAAAATSPVTQVPGSPFAAGNDPASVAFSPAGGLLASSNIGDDTLGVYAVTAAGALTPVGGSPFGAGDDPVSVAFSPDGHALAVADNDQSNGGYVSVYTVAGQTVTSVTGSPFATGPNDSTGVGPEAVAFSPDGKLLATANAADDTVTMFSVAADGTLTRLGVTSTGSTANGGEPESVSFSPDGSQLATADLSSGTVSIFSVGTGGTLTLQGTPSVGPYPQSAAFSPAADQLVVATVGESFPPPTPAIPAATTLYSVAAAGTLAEVSSVAGAGWLSFSPDGDLLASAMGQGSQGLGLYAVDGDGTLTAVPGSPYATQANALTFSAGFSPVDGLLATANEPNNNDVGDTFSMFQIAPPACAATGATTGEGQAVTVPLSCTNPTGSPFTYEVAAPPAHGTLGAIDQSTGQVTYTPDAAFSGEDPFAYRALADGQVSPDATASVTVNPASGGGSGHHHHHHGPGRGRRHRRRPWRWPSPRRR